MAQVLGSLVYGCVVSNTAGVQNCIQGSGELKGGMGLKYGKFVVDWSFVEGM